MQGTKCSGENACSRAYHGEGIQCYRRKQCVSMDASRGMHYLGVASEKDEGSWYSQALFAYHEIMREGEAHSAGAVIPSTLSDGLLGMRRTLFALGTLSLKKGEFRTARALFLNASRKRTMSSYAWVWRLLGEACWKTRDESMAQKALERASRIDDTHPCTWASLALVLNSRGMHSQAKQCVALALQFGLKDGGLLAEVNGYEKLASAEATKRLKLHQYT